MAASNQPVMPAPTLAIIVLILMVALYGVDKFLAAQEQSELRQEARNHYTRGQQLLHAGKSGEAVVDFARAHTIERSNREYQLALATAQLADHQPSAAAGILDQLLTEDSNDGRSNLLMARVLASEGQFKDADAYYHRAIYGAWPPALAGEPQKVRLELATMLSGHANSQELLSELLLLQSGTTADPAMEKQIAHLFLQAGSAQRAADAYARLLRENPTDVDAHLGLGQAEVLSGNYRAAENAVMSAIRLQPYNEAIQSQLRIVVKLASLDPTSRRLSTAEKYRRSGQILQLVQSQLNACDRKTDSIQQPQGAATNESAEAVLDQAEALWKRRADSCPQPPSGDDPLPLLMRKLAQ